MKRKRSGFSLIEVQMAIFVVAVGVLSMVALYPLGLRESVLSQEELKQSMFADYILNVAVAAACNTNLTWSGPNGWGQWAAQNTIADQTWLLQTSPNADARVTGLEANRLPAFMKNALVMAEQEYNRTQPAGLQRNYLGGSSEPTYAVYCIPVPGFSRQVMGIMVRSLDMDTRGMDPKEIIRRLEAQPVYYAEARFQGQP
jgi:type II secretory pathway pseudopilin PulG